jgi:hypothetical protein
LNTFLFAQEEVKLKDGRTIIINTNGTWKYKQNISVVGSLTGKWVFDQCERASDSSLKPYSIDEKSKFDKYCKNQNLYFIFSKDKTFESNFMVFSFLNYAVAAGTYEIVEDGKYIVLHFQSKEGQAINTRIEILHLTKNLLKINLEERFVFIYKRISR